MKIERKRVCHKCKEKKPLSEFSVNKGKPLGRRYTCKLCANQYSKRRSMLGGHKIDVAKRQFRLRLSLIKMLGGKCVKCGIDNPFLLCFDHINGDGYQDRKSRSSNGLLASIARPPERFQLLCHNCNYLKKLENQEYGDNRSGNYPMYQEILREEGYATTLSDPSDKPD